jgi:hypothetical protein
MRVIAFLGLVFGTIIQTFLDGQTFTHAVVGIIGGIAAILGGLGSARKDYADRGARWLGWIMAGLGLVLVIFCIVQAPSACKFQAKFNERSRQAREREMAKTMAATNDAKISVPSFEINVALTDDAAKKLQDAGESIKGIVSFDGYGIPKPGENVGAGHGVDLGDYFFERTGAGVILVTNALISAEAFRRLSDTNYYYTINVFSGRRVFADNILDSGYAEGHISDVAKVPIYIKCSLLGK